jgi:hypothetical protein
MTLTAGRRRRAGAAGLAPRRRHSRAATELHHPALQDPQGITAATQAGGPHERSRSAARCRARATVVARTGSGYGDVARGWSAAAGWDRVSSSARISASG